MGGCPGNITVHYVGNPSAIPTEVDEGDPGDPGECGLGGPGGLTIEYNIDCQKHLRWFTFIPVTITMYFLRANIERQSLRVASGNNGTDGANSENIKPSSPVAQEPIHFFINDYKKYLWGNLNDSFKKLCLMSFVDRMDANSNIQKTYDTLGLINELQALQEQTHRMNKRDLLHFHESFLNRTKIYSQDPKNVATSDDRKVLQYLHTATLIAIYNLKYNSEPVLVVDINGYLDLVMQNIHMLKSAQKEHNQKTMINKYKTNYKQTIDKKIKEASSFIETHIKTEIDVINEKIDGKIELLLNETLALQEQAIHEKEELMKKKQELEGMLPLRGMFSAFKVIGQVVGFLGPVGAAAGSVIGAGSSIAEALALDDGAAQQKAVELPPGVTEDLVFLGGKFAGIWAQKSDKLNKLLDDIEQEIKQYPERLHDTSINIAGIRLRLKQAVLNGDDAAIDALEKELKQVLENKEEELKTQTGDGDVKAEKAKAIVGKFHRVVELGALGFDIYSKHKNDLARLDAARAAISDDKIKKLEEYEKNIHNVITPMLRNMARDLNNIANKLEEKSQVALDIGRWQVQSALRDLKFQLQRLTKGYKVEGDLARCVEQLEEAMTTLINIYDRIQEYQQQEDLADYIADINSPASSNIQIKDPNLSGAVSYLEVLIRSNLVLQQSNTAIGAFKQWVFPLAHPYLKALEMDENAENIVSKAVTYIEGIKSKVQEYKTSIKREDEYTLCGWFNSTYVSSKPFFVWEHDSHKDMFTKLFSGKKVVAKADIGNSPPDKDAIKFNLIEIHFKSANETVQSAIQNKLKGFKASIVHLGNSYYRHNGHIYLIVSDREEIQYSFEKNDKGEPIHENIVYRKMKAGDLMLSPYTTWEIQLINLTDRVVSHEFKEYKDGIDLELVGRGSYISRGSNIPDLLVEDYYSGDAMSAEEEMLLEEDARLRDGYSLRRGPRRDKDDLRRRRHAAHAQKEHSDDRLAAASSAGSSLAPPGGRIVNWLKRKVWQLAHFNPMAQVRKLLGSDVNSSGNDGFEIADATWGSVAPRMDERFGLERRLVSDYSSESWGLKLLSGESDTSSAGVSHGIHLNGVLTLADFVARRMTGVQYENPQTAEKIEMQECLHSEYAQRLMFRSYVPCDAAWRQ